MDGTMFCVTCGSQQQAEYDHRTRVTACGTCGSILDSTAQVVTGAEETGEFTGRSFVYHGEERLFTAYSADAHRLVRGSRESGETYQAARMVSRLLTCCWGTFTHSALRMRCRERSIAS